MTSSPLSDLGLDLPVLAAPMAGGPTTPDLVVAAAGCGGLGLLAGGYRSVESLGDQIEDVRARTSVFGVNVFAPHPLPVDPALYRAYREALRADADRFGVELPPGPVEDDDAWSDKVDLLLASPVPLVSFTFGLPARAVVDALRRAGSVVMQTVTSVEEALLAADAGVDALAVQDAAAGGHYGTLTPDRAPSPVPAGGLLPAVRTAVDLPLVAAGGITRAGQVAAALRDGAQAVMVGTVLLRADEAGTSAAHRAALAGPDRGDTVVTRAFTGRPARALRNTFIDSHDASAPSGYPALHHLTSPLRRAAAARTDPEFVNLWAGTGYREATDEPAGDILRRLVPPP
jgi:nitronate monooxygenase